jgi:mono/diheme cytochrome c family protein
MHKLTNVVLISTILIAILAMASPVLALNFEESVANGRKLYVKNCASCHGAEGEGGIGPALNEKEKLDSLGLENVRHTIEEGVAGTAMPGWKGVLTEDEIEDLVNFIFGEWAGLIIVGIEMWPWEIAFVCIGSIWTLLGIYYIIRV